MNFGTGANIDQQFAPLKEVRPDSPLIRRNRSVKRAVEDADPYSLKRKENKTWKKATKRAKKVYEMMFSSTSFSVKL